MPDPAKSFADVLDAVLADRRKLGALFVLSLGLSGLIVGAAWLIGISFGVGTTSRVREIELSPTSAHFLLESSEADKHTYLLVVHPHGWQRTEITIKRGERVLFTA